MLRHLALFALLLPAVAAAFSPAELPVQGVLTDSEGRPVDAFVPITFSLYGAMDATDALFVETASIDVESGHFVAYLGRSVPLDWSLARDNDGLYLGIAVDGDMEMPRIAIATTPYSGWSDYSGNALTLDGFDVDALIDEVADSLADDVHDRYVDSEAVAAMGAVDPANPLNHARYSDADAQGAMGGNDPLNPLHHARYTADEARASMGNLRDENPYAHNRFAREEALDAMGPVADDNPYAHNRFAREEALAAMGAVSDDNPYAHDRFTREEALDAMGAVGDDNSYAHERFDAQEVVDAVSTDDRYVLNTGDTIDGSLTVNGTLRDDNSPSAVHFIKMGFSYSDGNMHFNTPDGQSISVAMDGSIAVDTPYITFRPGVADGADGVLYFNIDASPTIACTLLHNEDDVVRRGYYFATDSGNGKIGIWGEDGIGTFEIAREGVPGLPIANYGSFAIMCF